MKLTADNVEKIFMDCLFTKDEDPSAAVKVEGIVSNFGFHPDRLKSHEEDIYSMLKELPKEFQKDGGDGGWSFLNACNDKDGGQWTGLHQKMEQLFVLGIAIGKARWCMPKNMWKMFPGGMPYVTVL